MPVYEYYCERCQHKYDSIRPMAKRDELAPCPKCNGPGERQLSTFGFKYEGHYYMGSPTERRRTDPH
jgi:putative FmdB family regulatory protein